MAAHFNLATTFGVTLPAGAVPETADKTSTVETSKLVGTAGEYVKAAPLKTAKVEVSITGSGPAGLSSVVSGMVSAPATMTITGAEQGESHRGRATFTIKAAGHEAFTDGAGSSTEGTEPDIDTLEIVSVSYACAETVKKGRDITDLVLTGSAGTPFARGKCKEIGNFDIAGRGDLPSGVALGTGGAAIAGMTSGVLIATTLKLSEKAGDWNGWNVNGEHLRLAS